MSDCRKCQHDLVAYIHHELSPARRQRVAKHLDTCNTCYALYLQHQRLARQMKQDVPLIGQGHRPAFERIWAGIQQEVPRSAFKTYSTRYSLAAVVVMLMLIVPMTMGNGNIPAASPATQPAPLVAQMTPSVTESNTINSLEISLTPEAKPPKINAPSLDAISTP